MRGWANFGDARLPDRFWGKVSPCPMSGCWIWTGCSNGKGYGHYFVRRAQDSGARMKLAHRISFETLVGSVPAGLDLDHLCRNRSCCNPLHLEAVTRQENARRGDGGGHAQRKKNVCRNGHPFDGFDEHGYRKCKVCRAAQARTKYQRDKLKKANNQ